jgi:hypothetical protein
MGIDPQAEECRPYETFNPISEMGQSRVTAECPYCGRHLKVYLWSLAGCGKRCPCGALITKHGAYKPKGAAQ